MHNTEVDAGQSIFLEGDPADCAYLVEEGWVEIYTDAGGFRQVLSLIGPGEIFGEMGVIDGAPRNAGAQAAEDCRLVHITTEQFQGLLGRTEPFHAELLLKVVSRFRDTQRQLLAGSQIPRVETSGIGPGYAMLARHRDIDAALDRGEIEPFFQPIVDMETGRWRGFEALARWCSPELGVIPPIDFLPLAERTGLIRRIDWVIAERAIELCRQVEGDRGPYVNLNFSAWHFRYDRLVPTLTEMLERHRLPPSRVRVELTETLMLDDPDRALTIMSELAEIGVKLALDDFGTGYSSLSVLHRMPIHVLKIDRSLVTGCLVPGRRRMILRNVVLLAQDLGMDIVTEGVEDAETVAALRELGCSVGQGFLFARPMPAATAIADWKTRL